MAIELAATLMWVAAGFGVLWYIAQDLTECHREDSRILIGNVRAWYVIRFVSIGVAVASGTLGLLLWVVN